MKSISARRIGVAAIVSMLQFYAAPLTRAAQTVVAIKGEVTRVDDDLDWFNNSIQVGMPVEGTYNFFDAGYLLGTYIGDPSQFTYEYLLQPDPNFNLPVLPVNMRLAIGGHDYNTAGPNPIRYAINVFNDSNGFVVGDAYQVQSPLPFPAHFTDWVGDPVNDPDGIFLPFLFMTLELRDPTATALSSTDLPLTPPALSGFTSTLGHIYIADFNGEPNYAMAEFEITSFQLIPEPSSLTVFAAGAFGIITRLPGVRQRRNA